MEQLIVSITTWKERIGNLPCVLDSIFKQSVKPSCVVVNLSEEEFPERVLPENVGKYLRYCNAQVNWLSKNKGVWKKFIPTFELYPDALILCIDDDFVYPKEMILDFMEAHKQYPNQPISGNKVDWFGLKCHCGCASLVKREWFKDVLQYIDDDLIANCKSSDFVYTYLLSLKGIKYERTKGKYFNNLQPLNPVVPYSLKSDKEISVYNTYEYLGNRFKVAPEKRPKIFYSVPYNSNKNIGVAYNEFAALCPDDSYICFMDADTMPMIPEYGSLIEKVIKRYPDIEAFTCVTNRVSCSWQVLEGVDWNDDNIRNHHNIGRELADFYGDECRDVTDFKSFSGLCLLIKKSAWNKIGGAMTVGMCGVDNNLHIRLRRSGMKMYQMLGLYLYHWYRGGDKKDKTHLL